jgi:hypothetical protein
LKRYFTIFLAGLAIAQTPREGWRTYQDPRNRFQFEYPVVFGEPSPGTDNGFGNRAAAVRFSEFSAHAGIEGITLGGEAVLTTGPPALDLQAAGGLYDSITQQILPPRIATVVQNALPPLAAANLCDALTREQHLDPSDRRLSGLTTREKESLPRVDRMGNTEPKVLRCELVGTIVTFEKQSKLNAAGPARHIYGAIRFLPQPYSSFQLVRGGTDRPGAALLEQMTAVVNSWRLKE